MGEKIGFLTAIMLLGVFVIPFLMNQQSYNVQSSALLNVSTEFQKLVADEGGNTSKVKEATSYLKKKGLDIKMTDTNGNPIEGKQDVGTHINISYELKYIGSYGEETIPTNNSVLINRR